MRTFVVCTILVFCFFAIGCKGIAFRVASESMSPTLNPDDAFTANPFVGSIERFDIVVYKSQPIANSKVEDAKYVGRIVGLEGEKFEIKNGKILINDKEIIESFRTISSQDDFGPILIPDGEFFILGDNRPNSLDSRFWKRPTIKREDIYSKVLTIYPGYYKGK